MLNITNRIIKHKMGLQSLAEEQRCICKGGDHRFFLDTYCRHQELSNNTLSTNLLIEAKT